MPIITSPISYKEAAPKRNHRSPSQRRALLPPSVSDVEPQNRAGKDPQDQSPAFSTPSSSALPHCCLNGGHRERGFAEEWGSQARGYPWNPPSPAAVPYLPARGP